jgi:hypothetical protein
MNNLFNYLSPASLAVCMLIFILLACDKEDEERELMNMAAQSAGLVQIDTGINVIGLGLTGQLNAYIEQENSSNSSAKGFSSSTNARVQQTKDNIKEVKWSSSDESIATVDENGLVKGVAPGEVTITAAAGQDDQLIAQKTIRVTDGQSDISSFIINGVAGRIDGNNIIVSLPAHTDVTALQPFIKHTGMAIRPGNKEVQDFTIPVTYAVYGRDRSVTKWKAFVTTDSGEENTEGAFITTWQGEEIAGPAAAASQSCLQRQ